MNDRPGERPIDPNPDDPDEHAYEDTWYRALKAHSDRLRKDPPPSDESDPPDDD